MFTFSPLQITLASAVSDVQKQIIDVQNQLSSGKKVLNPGENGVVTRLTAKAAGYDVAIKNIDTAQNILSVGQTTLTSMATIVTQLSSLATQAAGGSLSDTDKASLDTTFNKLFNQLETLVKASGVNTDDSFSNNVLYGATGLSVIYDPSQEALPITGIDANNDIFGLDDITTLEISDGQIPDASTYFYDGYASDVVTDLGYIQDAISTSQSTLSAYQTTLTAMSVGATGLSAGLKSSVDSIQNIDSTAMQAKLQSLNNQQSIDYYLVSQMNTESAAILAIFR